MNPDYLMNIASILFSVCYIPEFYANYVNKNANTYNVLEKVIMLAGTSFGFSYSLHIHNKNLIANYTALITLDIIALSMRSYYAYKNRNRDVRVIENEKCIHDIENPIHDIQVSDYTNVYS